MHEINSNSPIEWRVTQEILSQAELDDWKSLIELSPYVTSSNSIDFNLNGLCLDFTSPDPTNLDPTSLDSTNLAPTSHDSTSPDTNSLTFNSTSSNLKPIYVLGYSEEINTDDNPPKTLKVAFILVAKTKNMMGMQFTLLQPISHDHIDMMSILGVEHLNTANNLSSLKKALNDKLSNWNLLSARRLRSIKPLDSQLISPTYLRQSAYLILQNIEGEQCKAKEIKEIIPKKLYKNIARFERKIEKEQQTNLELISNTSAEDVNSALTDFFNLEASGWKGKAGSAIQCNETLQSFYRKSWESLAYDGLANIYCLKSGEQVIASSIAVQTKDEIILHKIAFDEELSQYGPGSILVKHIIQNAIDSGAVKRICFNTNPSWLNRWHPKSYNLVALQIFNTNLKSQMINFCFKLADTLRLIKRRLKAK